MFMFVVNFRLFFGEFLGLFVCRLVLRRFGFGYCILKKGLRVFRRRFLVVNEVYVDCCWLCVKFYVCMFVYGCIVFV